MCDQQSLRSACAYAQSDQSLCLSLEYSISIKLLTGHHLECLSLKGGCTGSSESTLVKMPHCWKSHVTAQIISSFTLLPSMLCVQCHCNYAVYVPVYLMALINLSKTHPDCKKYLNRMGSVWQWQTCHAQEMLLTSPMNKHQAKSQGG